MEPYLRFVPPIWCLQGETLGKTTKGLVEPIQAQGNIGSAGLGWPQGRLKHR